jgi:capsular polysaccharide biosynthesis protein
MVLGGGAAFGLERLDRRIRSADDLAEMLQLPVLGVIQRAKPQAALPYSGGARARLR